MLRTGCLPSQESQVRVREFTLSLERPGKSQGIGEMPDKSQGISFRLGIFF